MPTEVSIWNILKSRMMIEMKKKQMKRMENRVEMRKRATVLVRVMNDSWFGIGSMVCNCGHGREGSVVPILSLYIA